MEKGKPRKEQAFARIAIFMEIAKKLKAIQRNDYADSGYNDYADHADYCDLA